MQEIYLAGGCFWGLQRAMDRLAGVIETEAGYANGPNRAPSYGDVRANSGHAETVRVVFDESSVSLAEVLDQYLSYIRSTGVSWQASGFGSQYRHAIFYVEEAQLLEVRAALDRAWAQMGAPAKVQVEPLTNFFPAEDYHQAHPKGSSCKLRRNECGACPR